MKSRVATSATGQSEAIYRDAVVLLDSFDLSRPVRLLGVRITGLTRHADQLPLFEKERKAALATAAATSLPRAGCRRGARPAR